MKRRHDNHLNFSSKNKTLGIAVALIFASSLLFSPALLNRSSLNASAQTSGVQGFAVISSFWGTSTSYSQAGPGDQNVPLTVTLQYLYSYSSISSEFEIQLPSGMTSTPASTVGQDNTNATAYYVNRLSQGQIFQITVYLDIANNMSLGQYSLPTSILWYAILTNSTSNPEVYLQQNVNIGVSLFGDSKLTYSTLTSGLTPGEINYVVLTLTNSGSGNVTGISTTVATSSQASILNQLPSNIALTSNSSAKESLQVYVPESLASSSLILNFATTYFDPYGNQESATQSLGLFVNSPASTNPLAYSISQSSLVPGGVNNITLAVTNAGASSVSAISTELSVSSSSNSAGQSSVGSQSISILSQPSTIATLASGSSATLRASLFISASAAGSPVTLTVESSYTSVSGVSQSFSDSFGMYVSTVSSSSTPTIGVTEINDDVTTGVVSPISIMIRNTGSGPIYNPTISLSTISPLVVSANSTFAMNGVQVAPGSAVLYEATILSAPSSTVGVYGGTLTVTYTNQFGVSNTQTVEVGFTLTGTIELVIQDEIVAQSSATNLTVSGTLLNEGTVSAYYANVAGYVQLQGGGSRSANDPALGPQSYVGEIDPNTPVPFTATIPYVAGNSAVTGNVTLFITYQDSFGRNLSSSASMSTQLLSASELTQQSATTTATTPRGTGLVRLVFFVIIIVIIVALVIGVIAVRRNRKKNVEAKGESEDSKVV